ncbi:MULTISPECIES: peroxiredoxin [unclassified Sphingomonas]|uniref:peroxiredoxin n=1 Tax=unclassified Sphingomonas TaxID=196159 RepID=UPI0006FA5154|nr:MULTISPECIES: peroxiredoxin [unclassified Sphingomonas]KQN03719.1 alkyl hydroperoxide reductase [Sphingomonas sp. Leaf25]KQN40676.1 alkyl hydroperoxide reductase [Sphingomonas sp. Leaf42]KQT30032.1 alkyl hydroperoxide reductase [Sphingomonas sp. Leaf407]
MTIQTGDRLPHATLAKVTPDGPDQVTTGDFFAGRTVALFAVPGAFTPTCSAKHLPGFVGQAAAFRAKGVDEIACTAVNDAFVLAAWGKANDVDARVTMLADGNGDFARALGLEVDSSAYGMGVRSKRYAMLVDDGVVRLLHVEQPGAFEVSSAEHLLASL